MYVHLESLFTRSCNLSANNLSTASECKIIAVIVSNSFCCYTENLHCKSGGLCSIIRWLCESRNVAKLAGVKQAEVLAQRENVVQAIVHFSVPFSERRSWKLFNTRMFDSSAFFNKLLFGKALPLSGRPKSLTAHFNRKIRLASGSSHCRL